MSIVWLYVIKFIGTENRRQVLRIGQIMNAELLFNKESVSTNSKKSLG